MHGIIFSSVATFFRGIYAVQPALQTQYLTDLLQIYFRFLRKKPAHEVLLKITSISAKPYHNRDVLFFTDKFEGRLTSEKVRKWRISFCGVFISL